ncbi:MAG: LysE family transporter [Rhodobacter sp.]|nr:LysE family transporter [Paracoccaceae bacterium]MCC0077619.1 LysE family transporter [Rhodobacter sp.]
MEYLPSLLGLSVMHLLMAMLPGPNTVVISWVSATRSRGEGLQVVAGVVCATLIWVALALWGVGALLAQAGWLYRLLRLAGAAYLFYVGWRLLRAGLRPAVEGGRSPRLAARSPFVNGMMTTLSNPKSAVFWTSVFLVAVPSHAPGWVYAAILVLVTVQTAVWYGAVAVFFSTGLARRAYLRMARALDLLAGGVMVALGLHLADEVRREIASGV